MLKPTRGRLLVTNIVEEVDEDSIIVAVKTKKAIPISGKVVAVGDPVTFRDKQIYCNAKPGDTVYFQRWSGKDAKKNLDRDFKIFLYFEDILAIKREECDV